MMYFLFSCSKSDCVILSPRLIIVPLLQTLKLHYMIYLDRGYMFTTQITVAWITSIFISLNNSIFVTHITSDWNIKHPIYFF